jgi:hypothetical protein
MSGHVEFVVEEAALGQAFSEYFRFSVTHSTDCSTLTITHHPGIAQ